MNMQSFVKSLGLASLALMGAAGMTSCQNDFDQPPIPEPKATMVPNTTIEALKTAYWQEAANYYETVGKTSDGSDVIIHGRVISSDATGNIYKSLVIQDETGALAFSINATGMNNNYRVGQEVVINATDLGIGKYSSLQQIGGYGEYNGTPQVSFMDYTLFQNHTELNGFPRPEYKYVNPGEPRPAGEMYCLVADMGNLPSSPEGLRQWQSELVVFRGVHFEEGGKAPFATADANTNRTLLDAKGNSIIVRNSNYSSFRAQTLPAGTGDVMGILSYFNGTWQLLLRSAEDCMFDSKGQQADPYTVPEAIKLQGTGKTGWVQGYIVGSVKAGVSDIDSNDKIIWSADAEMDNTLVIAPDAECKNIKECLVLTLPQGSSLRKNGNLVDNPKNYGKKILVTGAFDSYMGTFGLLNTQGTADQYEIDGMEPPVTPGETVASIDQNFNASTNIPAGWTNLKVKGTNSWFVKNFNDNNYASATGYKGTAPFEMWLITPAIDAAAMKEKVMSFSTQVNGYGSTTSKFEVYVMDSPDPTKAKLTKLSPKLAVAPASGYSDWVPSGSLSLSEFSGTIYIGFVYTATQDANYATWCLDDVLVGLSASSGTPDEPKPDTPDTGDKGSKSNPYTVADVQKATTDVADVWVEGYVVGWVNGMTWASGATFTGTPGSEYTNTNFILGPTAEANTTAACVPCAIPAGSLRDKLGLANNPAIYKKHVLIKGKLTKYFGQRGVKEISEYEEL